VGGREATRGDDGAAASSFTPVRHLPTPTPTPPTRGVVYLTQQKSKPRTPARDRPNHITDEMLMAGQMAFSREVDGVAGVGDVDSAYLVENVSSLVEKIYTAMEDAKLASAPPARRKRR
jgi:hypothetical protein